MLKKNTRNLRRKSQFTCSKISPNFVQGSSFRILEAVTVDEGASEAIDFGSSCAKSFMKGYLLPVPLLIVKKITTELP